MILLACRSLLPRELRKRLAEKGSQAVSIEPGSPSQNGFAESYNGRTRDELPNVEELRTYLEAQVIGGSSGGRATIPSGRTRRWVG